MEDKKLTPQESMELIASMIQSTKRRVASMLPAYVHCTGIHYFTKT